jgi:hypothetical protein
VDLARSLARDPAKWNRLGRSRATSDLKVKSDGTDLEARFALGSWLAFMPMGSEAMVMGDLVLTGDEVNPVTKKFLEGGIESRCSVII